MELIQIHISEPIWTRLCTRLPPGLEETVGYVWTRNSWPLRPFGPFFFGGHSRIMGTRWLPLRPFSAIPLYSCFQLVFVWRHRHDVADSGVIRGSLISVILVGVPLMSRKWRRSRRQNHPPQRRIPYSGGFCVTSRILRSTGRRGHPPQRYIPHSSSCFCDLQEIALADDSCVFLLQVCCNVRNAYDTLGRERDPCVCNSEPHQTEGSGQGIAVIQITSNISNLCPSVWFQISAFTISLPGQRRVPPLV
jgi:hypothetical protein